MVKRERSRWLWSEKSPWPFWTRPTPAGLQDIYGLWKTGVVGVLIRAKREGRISSLKDELDRLREDTGFWIDDLLYAQVLKEAGEV